jgi:hypothetical protein
MFKIVCQLHKLSAFPSNVSFQHSHVTIQKSIDGDILLEAHKQLPYDKIMKSPLPFYGGLNKLKIFHPKKK